MMEGFKLIVIGLLISIGLMSCASTGGLNPVVSITPAQVQSLAADVGYLGYSFTPDAAIVQPILAGVCSIDTTQDPVLIASELQQLLSQVWTGLDSINSPEATIIILLINNLVSDLGLNTDLTSATSNLSPYLISAVVGICQGVQAAQTGHMPQSIKASLKSQGITVATMGLPPALIVPGSFTQNNIGIWNKVKGSKVWFWNW